VNDHRQIQFTGQIQLRPQHGQLLRQVLLTEQIQAQLADRHHPGIGLGRRPQHLLAVRNPVLGVKGVDAHRIAQFREAVSQGADRRNLSGLHTGVHESPHTGLAPPLGHSIQVRIEVAEHDVAVGINQGRRSCSQRSRLGQGNLLAPWVLPSCGRLRCQGGQG